MGESNQRDHRVTAKPLALSVAGHTDAGRRAQNDDHLLIDAELGLFLVLDAAGSWSEMGGRASRVGADVIQQFIREGLAPEAQPQLLIESAFRVAGEALRAEPDENGWHGAPVVVLALYHSGRIHVSWLGNAMAHRLSSDQIVPLIWPHTLHNLCIRQGKLTEEAILALHGDKYRHILCHYLSNDTFPDPFEVISFVPQRGDQLILTSNGVSDSIGLSDLLQTCQSHPEPQGCANRIVELALEQGSRDNCTCVVIAFAEGDGGLPTS
jgi:PPM family protein phosphatase